MISEMTHEQIAAKAIVHEGIRVPTRVDRTFELPVALYAVTVGAYLGFLGILAFGFGNPALIIPMAIFVVSILAGFAIPTIWVRMKPDSEQKPLDWGRFAGKGIQTLTGRVTTNEAATQVLILPVLIVLWGIAVVTVAAIVR